MYKLNRQMLKLLGLGWLGFLVAGITISLIFPIPTLTVLIDRSYCEAPSRWNQLVATYTNLYHQHQQKTLQLREVILFSDLGQEVISPPAPEVIENLKTYGRHNSQRQSELIKNYPQSRLLSCQL
jgi:hypothetical protein